MGGGEAERGREKGAGAHGKQGKKENMSFLR